MYVIFLHVSALATIEILFYFYYIGIMETNIFISKIRDLMKHEHESWITNTTLYNDWNHQWNNTYQYNDYQEAKKNRIQHNNKLFHQCIVYLCIIFAISAFVILIEKYMWKKWKKTTILTYNDSVQSIHNICVELPTKNANLESGSDYGEFVCNETQENSFVDVSNNSESIGRCENLDYKPYIKSSIHGILYVLVIFAFEYWFFNNVVIVYKIISNEEIIYYIMQSTYDEL